MAETAQPSARSTRKRGAPTHSPSRVNSRRNEPTMECPVCMEEMEKPKLLHCGHNLCPECPHSMWKRRASGNMKHIVCPLCNSVTEVPEGGGLVTNFALREVSEAARCAGSKWAEERSQLEKKVRESTGPLEEKIRGLESEVAKLQNDLNGGPSPEKCGECKKGVRTEDTFVCLHPACTTARHCTLEPDFHFDYTVLEVTKLCALCVCLKHLHDGGAVLPLIKAEPADRDTIYSLMRRLHSEKGELERMFTALPSPFGTMFEKVMTEANSRCEQCLAPVKSPTRPLLHRELVDAYDEARDLYQSAKKLLKESPLTTIHAIQETLLGAFKENIESRKTPAKSGK